MTDDSAPGVISPRVKSCSNGSRGLGVRRVQFIDVVGSDHDDFFDDDNDRGRHL